ncbi:MAG TPA: DUF1707 domain-containing protein [Actinocrinis sp.]|jgi:hypothetical protein
MSSSTPSREPNDRPPALRASDADREHVVQLLGKAYSEGRLSADEHSERVEFAYASRTMDELRPLVADLPVEFSPTAERPAGTGSGATDLASLGASGDTVVAVFSEAKRTGRWLVRNGLHVRALFGTVELDLSEAVLEQREITITANALFGEVVLRVPDGVIVHDQGTALFGARRASVGEVEFTPETPVIRVLGTALFGSVESKRPKRKRLRFRL